MIKIGCCITPHGLGHAARCCALMQELSRHVDVQFEIVTTVGDWFFKESLHQVRYRLHRVQCDVGLAQRNALEEDLPATLKWLDTFYPLHDRLVDKVAGIFSLCRVVICDVAVLGIAAASRAGIPSVLLENFTWNWIYQGYVDNYPELSSYISYLRDLYCKADFHLQTIPACGPGICDVHINPMARQRRMHTRKVRALLKVDPREPLVLITMGGITGETLCWAKLSGMKQCCVLPGQKVSGMVVQDNLRLLPRQGGIYHPDLVAACDAVVGKVGYSTLAEVYQSGTPFGYIKRPEFPESAVLSAFVDQYMAGFEICDDVFQGAVTSLCRLKKSGTVRGNGAVRAARILVEKFSLKNGSEKL